jgi:hypothetical protein
MTTKISKASGPVLRVAKGADWKPHHDGMDDRAGTRDLPHARGREFPGGVGGRAPDE